MPGTGPVLGTGCQEYKWTPALSRGEGEGGMLPQVGLGQSQDYSEQGFATQNGTVPLWLVAWHLGNP